MARCDSIIRVKVTKLDADHRQFRIPDKLTKASTTITRLELSNKKRELSP